MIAPFTFTLPVNLVAGAPPERRGIARDAVRLMVIDRGSGRVEHTIFTRLRESLRPGDLLVFNASRTLPASLVACSPESGHCVEVRLAEHLPDDSWLALLLCRGEDQFSCGIGPGMRLDFGNGLTASVVECDSTIPRLWRLQFSATGPALVELIYRLGQPIRYEYVSAPWALDDYQTVYAREPGSAEMPSAGRAFTWRSLLELKRSGVATAFVVLHTGLSSYLDDELDALHLASEEEYRIDERAASLINAARARGGRVIAVGTTVVRALESVANEAGAVSAGRGYTRLHITGQHRLRCVDGLLTGMHEPEASHLDLLTAFLPVRTIESAYAEAIQRGYLWHEFGDLNLIV